MHQSTKEMKRRRGSVSILTYTILVLVVLLALGLLLLQSQYIYPRFIKLIIETTERDAIRTGRHMMRSVLKDHSGGPLLISEPIWNNLDDTREDYDLWKVKIFSDSGKTIYSSDRQDVGKVNRNEYFQEVVAKGLVHTKVVQKNTHSLEGQIVANDVVETYIPILDKGEFIGAFELYYNITIRKASMDAIIERTSILLYGLTGIIVLVVLGAAVGLRRGMRKRIQYEETLYALATTDTLTGTYNRRRFIELMEWELHKHERYLKKTSLLMLDIDRFKRVNDTYGHQSGDEVLVAVAQAFQRTLRESDLLARYGGEEFVVLLPETDREGAFRVAEKLRRSVEALTTPSASGQIQVTVSIGVADFSEMEVLSFDTTMKLADACLYQAKACGRNTVCTSDQLA